MMGAIMTLKHPLSMGAIFYALFIGNLSIKEGIFMQKIKKLCNIHSSITDKMKLIAGKPIEIGKSYNKITVLLSNESINEPLTALAYIRNRLILADAERKYFVFLTGDMSDFGGTLIAEHILTSIRYSKPITLETKLDELRNHYHFIPPNLLLQSIQAVQCL